MAMGIVYTTQRFGQTHLLRSLFSGNFEKAVALDRPCRDFHKGCKSAIVMVRHGGAADAKVFAASPAIFAFAARKHDVHHHPIPYFDIGGGVAGFDYPPAKLVPQDAGWGNFFVAVAVGTQVGAAYATGFDFEEDISFREDGVGDGFDPDVLFSVIDGCFHGCFFCPRL